MWRTEGSSSHLWGFVWKVLPFNKFYNFCFTSAFPWELSQIDTWNKSKWGEFSIWRIWFTAVGNLSAEMLQMHSDLMAHQIPKYYILNLKERGDVQQRQLIIFASLILSVERKLLFYTNINTQVKKKRMGSKKFTFQNSCHWLTRQLWVFFDA